MPPKRIDAQQEAIVREALNSGLTNVAAATAAGISEHSVVNLRNRWSQEGWTPPKRVDAAAAVAQTAKARETRWVDQRQQTGRLAGAMAGRLLTRVNEMIPEAGRPQIVVEQARDKDGNPTGVPRNRVLVPTAALDVLRLVEAAKGLYQLADRSIGISDETMSVSVTSDGDVGTSERRARVVDILERMKQQESA